MVITAARMASRLRTFRDMRNVSRVLTLALTILVPPVAATPTNSALPAATAAAATAGASTVPASTPAASTSAALLPFARERPGACNSFPAAVADSRAAPADFGCLPTEKRVELLSRAPASGLITPLNRDFRQHRALHQWKAQEAAALAAPPPADAGRPAAEASPAEASPAHPLSAYLQSREIESRRSQALKETRQAILRTEARILYLGTELNVATLATAQWIQRQPGRAPPSSYLQRIVSAADAIQAEQRLLKSRAAERDDLNRHFDEQLQQVLTLQG
jgi:hypothetical protein